MGNWANTTGETVDVADVAAGYSWSVGDEVRTGTNTDLALTTDPPLPGQFWYGSFGGEHPALSVVSPLATVPGFGAGEGVSSVMSTTEIPCEVEERKLNVFCGQVKVHRFVPISPDGDFIDTAGVGLQFVVETLDGIDIETGVATQEETGANEPFEIRFVTNLANAEPGNYRWAVRDLITRSPIAFGDYCVSYVPKPGDPVVGAEDSFCFTVTHQVTGVPLEGALVTVTDSAGEIVATAKTDESGNVGFPLDPGMYRGEFFFEDYKFEPYQFEVPE